MAGWTRQASSTTARADLFLPPRELSDEKHLEKHPSEIDF